jgi:hypothetical protein
LHNFLRKGPPETINNRYKVNATTICLKIYKTWKALAKTDKGDKKRTPFICLLIEMYAILLMDKTRIGFAYSNFIEGNFSLVPFFKKGASGRILSLNFIDELMSYLEKVISFH